MHNLLKPLMQILVCCKLPSPTSFIETVKEWRSWLIIALTAGSLLLPMLCFSPFIELMPLMYRINPTLFDALAYTFATLFSIHWVLSWIIVIGVPAVICNTFLRTGES